MSVGMFVDGDDFLVPADRVDALVKELTERFGEEEVELVKDYLNVNQWEFQLDDKTGDIVGAGLTVSNSFGDVDYELMQILAKYVDGDGYIEMSGEESDLWRWIFHNGEVQEVYARIMWPEMPGSCEFRMNVSKGSETPGFDEIGDKKILSKFLKEHAGMTVRVVMEVCK